MLLNYWKSCTQELGQGEGAGLVGFHLFFAKHTLKGPSSPLYLFRCSAPGFGPMSTNHGVVKWGGGGWSGGPQLPVLWLSKLIMQQQRQCLPSQYTGFKITQLIHQMQGCSEQKGEGRSALSGSEENAFNVEQGLSHGLRMSLWPVFNAWRKHAFNPSHRKPEMVAHVVIPVLGSQRQENRKFRVIHGYIANLRQAWAMLWEILFQKQEDRKNKKCFENSQVPWGFRMLQSEGFLI